MEREMKDVGMTWVALSKKAQDRDVWSMFVCGLYPDRMRGNDDDEHKKTDYPLNKQADVFVKKVVYVMPLSRGHLTLLLPLPDCVRQSLIKQHRACHG